jgi:uncharacterized protein involved in response to NO
MPKNPPSLASWSRLRSIPLLSNGIRPFFLAAGIWASTAMALWIAMLTGHLSLVSRYGVLAWHAHEFLFGYVGAVVAGFLLTAGPNWTGRPPLTGGPLLGLVGLWLAGRLALLAYDRLGLIALGVDASLLIVAALWFAREIIAARNWLNLRVVALITALATANVLFHWEVVHTGAAKVSVRVALSLIVSLIMVIAGRITPTFTRNWLIARKRPPYPTPFHRVDALAIALGVAGLVSWAAMPELALSGELLLIAGAAQLIRLARWRGVATWREPLLLILHLGYAFVPLGFLAAGLSVLRPDILPATAALHAWTAGAIGVTTLGVMTRVTLSDTGRPPRAPRVTRLIYASAIVAALLRIVAPLSPFTLTLLEASAVAWILAFAGFVLVYGPFLVRESAD